MAEQTRHLLLVEDEAALREAVAEQLTDRGYHVEQADSGEMAIERLADFAGLGLFGVVSRAEDGAALREAVAEQLTDRGYHVEQADSGEMAIERLADFAGIGLFDVVT